MGTCAAQPGPTMARASMRISGVVSEVVIVGSHWPGPTMSTVQDHVATTVAAATAAMVGCLVLAGVIGSVGNHIHSPYDLSSASFTVNKHRPGSMVCVAGANRCMLLRVKKTTNRTHQGVNAIVCKFATPTYTARVRCTSLACIIVQTQPEHWICLATA